MEAPVLFAQSANTGEAGERRAIDVLLPLWIVIHPAKSFRLGKTEQLLR
jgi:hypothetical protein